MPFSLTQLKEIDPWGRAHSLMGSLGTLTPEDVEEALPALPYSHRAAVSSMLGVGSPCLAAEQAPPSAMRYTGPAGHLLSLPAPSRASAIEGSPADYEQHLRLCPDTLLLLDPEGRERVKGLLGLSAVAASKEWVDKSGVSWPYTSEQGVSSAQLLKVLDGLPPIYLDESSRMEVLAAKPSLDIAFVGNGGRREDLSVELFQPWEKGWNPHALHDGESLRVWVDGTMKKVPFSDIRHLTLTIGGKSTDVKIGGAQTPRQAPAPGLPAARARQQKVSAKAIYDRLKDGMSVARIELSDWDGEDRTWVTARSFPDGTEDGAGVPHKFGEHPDSDHVLLWDAARALIVSVPVHAITRVSYSGAEDPSELAMDNELEGDATQGKKLEDVQYLKEYLEDMGKLHSKISGMVIGVADVETVGLLGKNYEDREDKSHGQILQVAGVKMKGGLSGLESTGDTLNLKARLSPHNQRILHDEIRGGFSDKMLDPESHSDVLSHNLAYVHREHMSFEDKDIFGLPLAVRYTTKRGKPGAKEHMLPRRLSEPDYERMMESEAELPQEVQLLDGLLHWLAGDKGYFGKVGVLCGHNFYSFDRQYINARLRAHNMGQLPAIPYLDTLHLAAIMFLPAVSVLAFVPDEDVSVPSDVKAHAKELVAALKSGLNLKSLAKAMGVPLDDDAHDALADTKATALVLERMLQWLEQQHVHFAKHAHYDRMRLLAWGDYAKGFRNRFKKRKA